jgi:DNA-binding CsgD family transcriptional regulator
VEREQDLAALESALNEVAEGRGRTVAVVGEPGIGKSRLVAAARERAQSEGMLVCSARGAELERTFPFGVVRQLAASSYADSTREERSSWFTGVAEMAAPLFREEAIVDDAGDATYARLHALYWLCANAARRRPLVLAVDDAHWADEASLAFVGFLARRVEEIPLLLLLGARPPDPRENPELAGVLADPGTTTLAPEALTLDGVAALLRAVLARSPDPAFVAACHQATAGNPFLLGELAGEIRAEGMEPTAASAPRVASLTPAGVRTTTLVRLARLGEPARALARTLALLGDHTPVAVAAELAELERAVALDAAASLEEAGIVARDEGLSFVHPLLRAAIADDIPSVERVGAHGAAARALAREGAAADQVSVHLLRTEPAGDPWVVETLRAGAARALAFGDPETAGAYLRRALDEPAAGDERPRVLLELGLAEARASAPAAVETLSSAVAAASDPDTICEASLRLAQVLNLAGRADDAAHVLEDGISALEGRPDLLDPLKAELIATAYVRISTRRRLDPLIRSLRDPERTPSTQFELFSTAALAAEYAISRGHPKVGLDLARRALASPATARRGPVAEWQAEVQAIRALMAAEELEEAEAAVTSTLEAARAQGNRLSVAAASGGRAAVRLRRDDLLGAEADATACLELLAGEADTDAIAMGAAATVVRAGLELGRALGDLDRVVEDHRGDPDYPTAAFLLIAEGTLRFVAGDLEQTLSLFERCSEYEWVRDCPALYPWRSAAARVLGRMDRASEGRVLAEEELRLARAAGTPRAIGVALQASAAVAGSDPEREPLLEEAVTVLGRGDAQVELARALLARGALRRRSGQRKLAREDLERAHELASSRAAVRIAEEAATELKSSGVQLRRSTGGGADELTPSERRVAEIAAQGATNREIAQSLFLSEKTVEAHLGRAYRKLGIRSRGRLAAALGSGEPAAS